MFSPTHYDPIRLSGKIPAMATSPSLHLGCAAPVAGFPLPARPIRFGSAAADRPAYCSPGAPWQDTLISKQPRLRWSFIKNRRVGTPCPRGGYLWSGGHGVPTLQVLSNAPGPQVTGGGSLAGGCRQREACCNKGPLFCGVPHEDHLLAARSAGRGRPMSAGLPGGKDRLVSRVGHS